MSGKLLITKLNHHVISALIDEKGDFTEINCFNEHHSTSLGNIYIGKVKNIVKNINAVFIEYANKKMGYYDLRDNSNPIIVNKEDSDKICVGDEVVVQVAKEAVKTKDPVLSSNLEMVGKYSVVTLNKNGISFSKKFNNNEKKDVLKEEIKEEDFNNIGVIIRTNAADVEDHIILDEIGRLKTNLFEITKTAHYRTCYSVLLESPKEYITNIRDMYEQSFEKIITDDSEIFNNIKEYMLESQMDINKLEYYYDDLLPLYKLYNIEKCLKDITKERVWLKSGAYLVIQPTEALVVIDVNSGKNASNKKVSNQFMKINLEAAKEIAVQIRLRNLSGIIIIDFINMKDQEDKETLLKEFDGYLKEDRLNATIIDMTKLDLVEVTRKKVRKSIYEQLKYE